MKLQALVVKQKEAAVKACTGKMQDLEIEAQADSGASGKAPCLPASVDAEAATKAIQVKNCIKIATAHGDFQDPWQIR